MIYTDIYNLRYNADLVHKTAVAVSKTAIYILDGGDPQNPPSANIIAGAKEAMRVLGYDIQLATNAFMWYVVANGDVQTSGAAVADTTIQFVVDSKRDLIWG